jgi:hypothetical protein
MIDQEKLLALFDYVDGRLLNRVTRSPKAVKGAIAGTLNKSSGYYQLTIDGTRLQLSHAVWVYHNGKIPLDAQIDHIDRDPHNNSIENLRIANKQQNEWNKPRLGCNFEKGKWRARVKQNGKSLHLGLFDTKEAAQAAYKSCAAALHGEFQWHS